MDSKTVKTGELLARRDGIVDNLWYIVEGRIEASRDNMKLTLKKGDFIGIADFSNGAHSFDYTAIEDSKLLCFCPIQMVMQSNFFSSKADNARAIALSMNHYLRDSFVYLNSLCNRSEEIHNIVNEYYDTYKRICRELTVELKPIDSLEELSEGVSMDFNHKCLYQYHKGTYTQLANKDTATQMVESLLIPGYMIHANADFNDTLSSIGYVAAIIEEHNDALLGNGRNNLMSRFLELYSQIGEEHSASSRIMECMLGICNQAKETDEGVKEAYIEELKNKTKNFENKKVDSDSTSSVSDKLAGSFDQLIELLEVEDDKASAFKKAIKAFKDVIDSNTFDDESRALRKEIEKYFYKVYLIALEYSIEHDELPVILKMFLYFGYMDEELAGIDNACELYELAQTYSGRPDQGLFTAYEWLIAVYRGLREPSINEFDQTFEQFINEQVGPNGIPQERVKAYLKDRGQMVMFELQNMFRSASRICSGRILDFCPIFCDYQILRSPKEEILNPSDVIEARDSLRNIDYTLFYRETMYVYDKKENVHDMIHVEILPDFVLMPVVGSRGAMWQEISGRNRMTPARMMLPIFDIEKLDKAMIRMFAEYRWEMCKRVQGARWNDVTEPSLTSLYYDYLQFYRKNSQISVEQKEKIKIGLQRARNVYKEYFINDYTEYVKYESAGSPHLIRASRAILYMQCPFSAEIRATLGENPIFKELNDRLKVKNSQQLHKLDNIKKKLISKERRVPVELDNEIQYYRI